ncbi:MAG TPA: signal recognition particle protein, partial [Nitrolancea sp.]|nr:signal recognition particle protein [Nitrolancea sp.]
GGRRGGKIRSLLSGNPLAGMNSPELEAMMQGGGTPALGRGGAPARPAPPQRKKGTKKKPKGRRR